VKRSILAMMTTTVVALSLFAGGTSANAAQTPVAAPSTSSTIEFDQVSTRGSGGSSDQYIRITNTSSVPQDISNFMVEYRVARSQSVLLAAIPQGTVLRPGQHYLLADPGYPGSDADQFFTLTLTPPFVLILLSPAGDVIDEADIPLDPFCLSGLYVPGIPHSSFHCAPRSGGK
jgi:Lamin Tail Domain